jgi:hypothetical protein
LNIAGQVEIPFVFGGDGASILIPSSLLQLAKNALISVKTLAQASFGMELRVGIVPVTEIMVESEVNVAKLQISPNYTQAIFKGGGLTYATQLVKDSDIFRINGHNSDQGGEASANFTGLECRWQDIESKHGEILSLIILATTNQDQSDSVYRKAIAQIEQIYGSDHELNPVAPDRLNLTFNHQKLQSETKAKSQSPKWLDRQFYLLKIMLENLLAWIVIKLKVKTPDANWAEYKNIVTDAVDYRKFDDLLRMVISSSTQQRKALINYLELEYLAGKIVYGFHVSDRALMTCLVFERNGRQVHFVDGADGGYTYAAKVMKTKLLNPKLKP